METIERKTLLYKSGLGFWCVNHVQGCSHGCLYPCYAFMMARSYGRAADYGDWTKPRLVAGAADLLRRELSRKRTLPDRVHLSLTTDPFMRGFPEVAEASLSIVEALNEVGVAASVLTKGVLPAELADRGRFPLDNEYGASLASLDEGFRARWEPGAAPYAERLAALRLLSEAGRRTYVHVEPYPTPNIFEQDLRALLEAVGFADRLYFSGWNYNALATNYPGRADFYREAGNLVARFCEERGIECSLGI